MVDSGFRERLKSGGALLLDSAMGTELERRGARTAPPLWSAWALLESPELVPAIHRDEVAGGAEILTANTFRTPRRTLAKRNQADPAAGLPPTARPPAPGR